MSSIPPPDFNSDNPLNINDDQYIEEEADSFRDLMKSQSKEQEKTQQEAREQLRQNEDARKSLVQREEMKEDALLQQEEHGVEEEDSKKLNEEQELKESEEKRMDALKKGKQSKSARAQEEEVNVIDDNQKITEEGEEQGIEHEDPLHDAKQQVKKEQMSLKSKQVDKDSVRDIDESEVHEEQHVDSKKAKRLEETQEREATRRSSKSQTGSAKPKKKADKSKEAQSIAINLALGSQNVESTRSQKGGLDPKIAAADKRKEVAKLVQKIIEEAQVLKDGDEVQTIISLDMPDSVFDKGEITVTAHKYRPLEVNLKFQKFSDQGTKMIHQNKDELKNLLKINSLKVHQLDVIE